MTKTVALLLLTVFGSALAQSPYAGQEVRDVKSLSPNEIQGFLNGSGMGFAKVAELNGYPGPKHVLELALELDLTEEQRKSTQLLFDEMKKKASALGAQLIAGERQLDESFRTGTIDSETLNVITKQIGDIRSQIRASHLEAHLQQSAILNENQIIQYMHLRGYQMHHHSGHNQH